MWLFPHMTKVTCLHIHNFMNLVGELLKNGTEYCTDYNLEKSITFPEFMRSFGGQESIKNNAGFVARTLKQKPNQVCVESCEFYFYFYEDKDIKSLTDKGFRPEYNYIQEELYGKEEMMADLSMCSAEAGGKKSFYYYLWEAPGLNDERLDKLFAMTGNTKESVFNALGPEALSLIDDKRVSICVDFKDGKILPYIKVYLVLNWLPAEEKPKYYNLLKSKLGTIRDKEFRLKPENLLSVAFVFQANEFARGALYYSRY